jgi:uncharacterized protein (DUF736 family)
MAAAFRTLMADPELLASWRATARQGSEYFSVARMANDYDQVYEAMLGTRRRSG